MDKKTKAAAKPKAKAKAKATAKPKVAAKASAKAKTKAVAKAPAKAKAAAAPKAVSKATVKSKAKAKSKTKAAASARNVKKFSAPQSQDFTIADNSGVIGQMRVKPNAIAWKPKRGKAYHQVSLEQLAAFAAEHGREVRN